MNELFPASEPWGGGLPPRPLQSSCHYQARRSWDVGRGRGWAGHRRAFRRVNSLTGEWRVVVISCPLARVGRGGGGVGKPCRVWGASPSGDGHRSFWKAAEQTWAEGAHPARGTIRGAGVGGGWCHHSLLCGGRRVGSPPEGTGKVVPNPPTWAVRRGHPSLCEGQPQALPATVCRLGPDRFAPKTPG